MSTPSSARAKSSEKLSLDLYELFERQANQIDQQKNENPIASSAENVRLKNIHANSNSLPPSNEEKILLDHEITQNSRKQNELKEKLKISKQAQKEQTIKTKFDHIGEIDHTKNRIKNLLADRQLALLDARTSKVEITDDDNIQNLLQEIETLESSLTAVTTLLQKLSISQPSEYLGNKKNASEERMSGGESSDDGDDAYDKHSDSENPGRVSNDEDNIADHDPQDNLKNIIIRRTTTKRRSPTESLGNTEQKDEKQPDKASTSNKQEVDDDIAGFLSLEIRKKVIKIDNKIIKLSKKADDLLKEIKDCKSKLDSKEESENELPNDQLSNAIKLANKNIEKLEFLYAQTVCDIGKLYLERDALGKPFLSLPAEELPDPEHITEAISSQTIALENIYKEKLGEYKTKVNEDPDVGRNEAFWSNVGGAAAFGSSFLFTNTASKFGQLLGAPSWVTLAFAPVLSGVLHTVVATPIAKQFMLRTWKSPVLAEMNNYFRLMGAYWHDRREGNLEEKKYASKDATNKNLLTIEERRKEERGLWQIFKDRLYYEENPYLIYSGLYSAKSMIQTAIFQIARPSQNVATGVDMVTHAFAGFVSGAMYLEMQQDRRSTHPGNTVEVNPTREIHQAQADWLHSLRNDLKGMIASIEAVSKEDPRLRTLSVKLHKTEVALATAEAKAGRFSAFLHDFKSQFKAEVLADTLADMAGRIVSLYPTAVVNSFCEATLRKSSNPMLIMLSYILPSLTLIGFPGFQARGLYGGIIRACIQSVFGAGPTPDKTEKATQQANRPDEDNSVIVTLASDSGSGESDANDSASDHEQWTGRPSSRLEELV